MLKGQGSIEYIYIIGGVLIAAFIVVVLMISLVDDSALVFPDFLDDKLPGVHCGDGQIEGAESCDDDNKEDGDGCTSTCVVELGFLCTGEPSVCTN